LESIITNNDAYPMGDSQMPPDAASLVGRNIGRDFVGKYG
jgi:hypothetical protein